MILLVPRATERRDKEGPSPGILQGHPDFGLLVSKSGSQSIPVVLSHSVLRSSVTVALGNENSR